MISFIHNLKFKDGVLLPQRIKKTILSMLYGRSKSLLFIQELEKSRIKLTEPLSKTFSENECREIFDKFGNIYQEEVEELMPNIIKKLEKERQRGILRRTNAKCA